MRKLAIIVEADDGLLPPGALTERLVKPLAGLGLSLVFEPLLKRDVEAEILPAAAAGDGVVILGRIAFVNGENGPALSPCR